MSETAATIEASFRKLLHGTRYRSITVKDICEDAGVSRKTFYVYFDGKDAIVDRAFRRDVVDPVQSLGSMLSNDEVRAMGQALHERLFLAVMKDGAYYRELALPMRGSDPTFINIVSRALQELYGRVLQRVIAEPTGAEARYVSYYFGTGLAHLLERWVCDGYAMPADKLAKLYADMALPYWKILSGGGLS